MMNEELDTIQDRNFITCLICGAKMKKLTTSHLLFKHEVTISEYQEQFPGAPLVSLTSKALEDRAKLGHEVTERTKEKISAAQHKRYLNAKKKKKN